MVPMELHAKLRAGAREANVSLVDKKSQDYEDPLAGAKPKVESFTGSANRLGSV